MINVLLTKEELEAVISWGEFAAEASDWEDVDEEAMKKFEEARSASVGSVGGLSVPEDLNQMELPLDDDGDDDE